MYPPAPKAANTTRKEIERLTPKKTHTKKDTTNDTPHNISALSLWHEKSPTDFSFILSTICITIHLNNHISLPYRLKASTHLINKKQRLSQANDNEIKPTIPTNKISPPAPSSTDNPITSLPTLHPNKTSPTHIKIYKTMPFLDKRHNSNCDKNIATPTPVARKTFISPKGNDTRKTTNHTDKENNAFSFLYLTTMFTDFLSSFIKYKKNLNTKPP